MAERGTAWGKERVGILPVWVLVLLAVAFPREAAGVEVVRPKVVRTLPHDTTAFTQGLLWFEGYFFESTGQYGRSTLRRVEPETGRVVQRISLNSTQFGEGLARIERQLLQLTWRSGVAYRYDLDTFEQVATYRYDTEGWGVCFDGDRLVMTDGSSRLFLRDASSFALRGTVEVSRDGVAVARLNELECVDGWVYANVWQTDRIVVIDPSSGRVGMEVDASGLLTAQEARRADVLNGIAHHPETGRFYITGKNWPKVFEVELPRPPADDAPARAVLGARAASSVEGADESSSAMRVRRGTSTCACGSFGYGAAGNWACSVFSSALAAMLWWRRRRLCASDD